MAFATLHDDGADETLTEINMIPLIDVMLVLLVIFIVAAPLLDHAVKVELPRASSAPAAAKPQTLRIALDADGRLYWNGEAIEAAVLEPRLAAAAAAAPQSELHLAAARTTPYERIAQIMAAAARHGLTRIGFVTEPAR